jgi:DNA-binding NarL/FixJ family response regulator
VAARALRRGAVLVVDDDEATRELLSAILERAGYAVVTVATGEEALLLVDSQSLPTLVILDVRLPGLSGYEVCSELRERYANEVPIIFLSGERVEPFDVAAGLGLGADDYLLKPFATEELLARVRRIHQHPNVRELASPLSSRELEILTLLANGRKQHEIAHQLSLSPKTVSSHIRNLLGKLDARSPAQAAAEAVRRRLLDSTSRDHATDPEAAREPEPSRQPSVSR